MKKKQTHKQEVSAAFATQAQHIYTGLDQTHGGQRVMIVGELDGHMLTKVAVKSGESFYVPNNALQPVTP